MWEPTVSKGDSNDDSTKRFQSILEALRPFGRLREIRLAGVPLMKWQSGAHDAFEEQVLTRLSNATIPINNADCWFDLWVWVRVEHGAPPIQGWVARLAQLDMAFGTDNPFSALSFDHTLFRDGNTHGEPNRELHLLNAPLLRTALNNISLVEGPITEVDGFEDVNQYGFLTRNS